MSFNMPVQIIIRKANKNDIVPIRFLYRDTIIAVNSKDYNEQEIAVWAGTYVNIDSWLRHISDQYFFVAEISGQLVGFSSLEDDGYHDFMYVHKDFQKQGIATMLMESISAQAKQLGLKEIYSHVSRTAMTFFEKNGYTKKGEQINKVKGIEFINSVMVKEIKG